jgi:hypothetical protein
MGNLEIYFRRDMMFLPCRYSIDFGEIIEPSS